MVIPDPFSLKTVNNFNSSPPFGLFDIFNHLIHQSTDYDKQGLAACKSFDDYRLFNDEYVESLLTTQLKQRESMFEVKLHEIVSYNNFIKHNFSF